VEGIGREGNRKERKTGEANNQICPRPPVPRDATAYDGAVA